MKVWNSSGCPFLTTPYQLNMERNYDSMLSPDFDDPLQYFDSSLTTSRATPTIYADDPWSVTEDAITFESNSTYPMGGDLSESSYFLQNTQEEIGSEITSSNVLGKYVCLQRKIILEESANSSIV